MLISKQSLESKETTTALLVVLLGMDQYEQITNNNYTNKSIFIINKI